MFSKRIESLYKRFIVTLAGRICRLKYRRSAFWIVTCRFSKDGCPTRTVRWFERSRDGYFPYQAFVSKFRIKFGATPSIISAVEISEYEYLKCTNKMEIEK